MNLASRLATGALLLLPGALTVYFSFNAGGFFPDTVAFAALVLAVALALRVAFADEPFEGVSVPLVIGAGALALFAVWTLVSGRWSHAPGRALIEFDRALLYLLALVLFGSMLRDPQRIRWMVRGLALAIVAVCAAGLATRLLPDVFPTASTIANNRLSYPLTYWNSLGLLAALGVVLCFHLASSRSESPPARVLGAAAIPLLATTVLFTFSRGAIAAGIVGLLTYIAVARPRALLSGLLASVPAATVAVIVAYDADLLASLTPATPAAAHQGHDVALAVGGCMAGAAIVRALLLALDSRLPSAGLFRKLPRPLLASAGAVAVAVLAAVALALDVPGGIAHQYDRFTSGTTPANLADARSRLTNPANQARIEQWDIALDAFVDRELDGHGAGTYQNLWAEHRRDLSSVTDAHSLYLEVLGELGLVGLALVATVLVTILVLLATRARGASRTLYAALFAAVLMWALRAGVDWDWEMPAVTLWLFAVGGATLAASERRRPVGTPRPSLRIAAILACFAIAVVPGLVLISQTKLDNSADAFARGDCTTAVKDARSSISALDIRPEPYEILAYCASARGAFGAAVRDLERAVARDPRNWTYRFDLAFTRAAAGLDPRQHAREALRLNPLDTEAQFAAERLTGRRPAVWKREGRELLAGSSPFYLSER